VGRGFLRRQRGEKTLILHWDGTAWTQVPGPAPGPYDTFSGVSAVSRATAWAVGQYNSPAQTLALRWNGTAWVHVHTPNVAGPSPGTPPGLTRWPPPPPPAPGRWGTYQVGLADLTLIARWNGTSWAKVPSLNRGTGSAGANFLEALAVTSATSAWAVGSYSHGSAGGP
jgi:hypothetical protein